jgi:glycosyltransferase involved in cell wall biosynthesis
LAAQTLPASEWETLLIDNASPDPIRPSDIAAHPATRIVPEPRLGLTFARRRGLLKSRGEFVVLVDDDNILHPEYLANALGRFAQNPSLGAIGGPCRPEFETPPEPWKTEFFGLLALRDLGDQPLVASLQRHPRHGRWHYPECSPIGAGMALRREAALTWLHRLETSPAPPDRQGASLSSGGDNDIVLTLLHAGWQVAYFPELAVTHLIPSTRLDPAYLARLNRGIQHSWMQVLLRHDACPWPTVPAWTVPLRQAKAWLTRRAWTSPAARIRWQGACGHFSGRVEDPA